MHCSGKNFMQKKNKHYKREPQSQEKIVEKRILYRNQLLEVREGKDVTCADCKNKTALINAYKCFYCGLWFCKQCARAHFGVPPTMDAENYFL